MSSIGDSNRCAQHGGLPPSSTAVVIVPVVRGLQVIDQLRRAHRRPITHLALGHDRSEFAQRGHRIKPLVCTRNEQRLAAAAAVSTPHR